MPFTIVDPVAAVPSPCVKRCGLNAEGLCQGCGRTDEEIAAWPRLDDATKRRVWARLDAQRAAALESVGGVEQSGSSLGS